MTNRSKQSDKISASAKTGNRDSLVKLRAHVNDIENRLKRANKLTKSSVTALTSSFEHLHANGGFDKNTQRLAQYIDELAGQLNGLIEQTRIDVAHDLKAVMSDPRLETVSAALTKANQRLTLAEAQQADAIGAINGQIAKLATAMDARMQREVRAREESIAALDNKIGTAHDALEKNQLVLEASLKTTRETNVELGTRIDAVETLSADAVKTIGNKVVSVTEELQQQTQILQQQTQALKNDVGEQGLDLQKGYEEHKEEMARRIESLEDDQRNTIPSLERRLITLATRLEVMESYEPVAAAPVATAPVQQDISSPPPPFNAPEPNVPSITEVAASTVSAMSPSAPFGSPQTDAFSPSEQVILKSVPAPQTPYATQAAIEDDVLDLMAGTAGQSTQPAQPTEYVPQEYVPQDYVPEIYTPDAYVADTPVATLDNSQYPAEYAPSHAPFNAETGAFEQASYEAALQQTSPVLEPATLAPASLETAPPPFAGGMPPMESGAPSFGVEPHAQSMSDARPGAEPEKKSRFKRTKAKKIKQPKGPSGSGGNGGGISAPLRLGGLMVGVAVVGLFAAKTVLPKIMGSKAKPTVQAQSTARPETRQVNTTQQVNANAQRQQGVQQFAQQPTTQPLQTVAAVGDYSQTMQAPDLGVGVDGQSSAQKVTLEAAATNGEPIAQFQLGLSHLEAGRNAQAVRFIRLAANQGQAAAQYRLGKLYEAGVGVESNLTTAMGLLEKSAASGNRIAMHDLGHYHATGAAGEANIATAVDWFEKAAERGVLDSQFNLGVLYQGDSGISRDLVSSYVWFAIAGAQGDKVAEQRGALVARDLKKDQLSEGKKRVEAFSPTRINDSANGIFRDLPWATKSATAAVDISNSVKGAQTMLSGLGYDVGTPDGAMGPRTRNAVISFERANGLPETGRVNAALVDRLTLASGS